MKQISLLKNPIQPYAWGSKTYLQSFLDLPKPWHTPAAELWMGAHPKAPSEVQINGKWQSLNNIIKKNPTSVLGKKVAERFSNRLPFLFKLLAVERPLSIQVHPDKDQATAGYDRENRLNIPLDAANRNYKDANHKPECLCAVTGFEAMKGFRSPQEILNLMDRVFPSSLQEEKRFLRENPGSWGLKGFFSNLMGKDPEEMARRVKEAVGAARQMVNENRAFHWLIKLNEEYPEDPGVLSPLYLNLLTLSPGEAVYVPAGELHAYLSGVGVEIMANSDNVLRGGLTPKHVDKEELLSITQFSPSPVEKLKPVSCNPFEKVYQTPANEFQLSSVLLQNGRMFTSPTDRSAEVLLCMDGKGHIEDLDCGRKLLLKKGGCVIVPSAVTQYAITGEIVLFKATVESPLFEGQSDTK